MVAALWLVLGSAAFSAVPSVDELRDKLIESEGAIHNLSVTSEIVKQQRFMIPGDQPAEMKLNTQFIVERDHRSWYECRGEQINFGPKPGEYTLVPGRWQTSFDGETARSLTADREGNFHWGGLDNHPSWHGVNPLEFTTHYFRKPVSQYFQERIMQVVEEAIWDERPVVIVETDPVVRDHSTKTRFWIDPARQIVVRRAALIQFLPDQPWQEYTRIESRDHQEVSPAIWLPRRFVYESVTVTKDLAPEVVDWRYEGRNRDWQVNREVPASTYRLEFPPNVIVTDRRTPKRPSE